MGVLSSMSPCSLRVDWLILDRAIEMSVTQAILAWDGCKLGVCESLFRLSCQMSRGPAHLIVLAVGEAMWTTC